MRLELIYRAANALPAFVEDVCIDHRGADVLVTKQLLDSPYVVPVFQEVSCEAVAERVTATGLCDPRSVDRRLHRLLKDFLGKVVSRLTFILRVPTSF